MDINLKVAEVKNRVKELTGHFPYSEFEINIITICYMAIASIDNDITDIIDEVLSRIFILFNNGKFNEILEKLEAPLKSGGFHRNAGFAKDKKDSYEFIGINVFRAYVFECLSMRALIEYVLHEMKHAINGIINSYKKTNSTATIHVGLSEYDVEENEYRTMWEETFNDYITKIYLRQVEALKNMDIQDPGIRKILDEFELEYDLIYGYDCTELCLPLFNTLDNFKAFYNASLYKDYSEFLKTVQSSFPQKLEDEELPNEEALDYIDSLLGEYQKENNEKIREYFKQNIGEKPNKELVLKPHFEHI